MRKMSKKFVALFAMMLIALAMFATSAAARAVDDSLKGATPRASFDYEVGDVLYVNVDALWMHSRPDDTEFSRMEVVGYRARVVVEQTLPSQQWLKVQYVSPENGITCHGYCAAYDGYFISTKPAPSPTPTEKKYSGNWLARVTAPDGLRVHKTPYIISTNLRNTLLEYNWEVKALAKTSNGMIKVQYYKNNDRTNTEEGYVSEEYLYVYKASVEYLAVDKKFTNVYGYTVKSTADVLNVHQDLLFWGNDTRVIDTVEAGTSMNLIKQSEHWYYVSYWRNGILTKGYVRREWATKIDALKRNVSLNKLKLVMDEGDHFLLQIIDKTAPSALSKTAKWKSSDKSVVTVTKAGALKAKGEGTAKITCTVKVGNRTRKITCKVTVNEADDDDDDEE